MVQVIIIEIDALFRQLCQNMMTDCLSACAFFYTNHCIVLSVYKLNTGPIVYYVSTFLGFLDPPPPLQVLVLTYSILPNRRVYTFISGQVCLLGSIKVYRQTWPEINVYTRLFGSIE